MEEARIIALEEKHTHLERYVEELDSVIRDLDRRLVAMGDAMTRLREETRRQIEGLDGAGEPEEPPADAS